MEFVSVQNVHKSYGERNTKVVALSDVSFELKAGESLAILGGSGAGKSTLLNILGGLDDADAGNVFIDGVDLATLREKEKAVFRNQVLGFVFQFHNLLKDFSVLENIMMPLSIRGLTKKQILPKAMDLLAKVDLLGKENRLPQELSGGEQQRVALVRALIHDPKLILADEPTGNLDSKNAMTVFELLCTLNHDLKAALVVVTHNLELAKKLKNHVILEKGRRI